MSSPPIWCFSNPLGEVCGGGTDIMPPYFRATFRWFKVTATASLHSVRLTHKATVESNVNATELSDPRTHEIQFSAQREEWCDKLQTLSRGGASTIETATSKTFCGCFFVPRLNSANRTRQWPRPNDSLKSWGNLSPCKAFVVFPQVTDGGSLLVVWSCLKNSY